MRSAPLCFWHARATRLTETRLQLFLNDLGILDHRDAAALCQLAFHGDVFATQIGKFIVHWLVFADDQIRFTLTDDADRATAPDAFGPAGLPVFFAHGVMIDEAHHIDHLARDLFRSPRFRAVLVLLRDRQRRGRQSCDECRSHRNSQDCRFIAC